jgi:signal peptidase I
MTGEPKTEGSTHRRSGLPAVPDALLSLLQTVVAALFLLTFVVQPYLIPSESMEKTLLVGDFLLVNKQVFAKAGGLSRWLLPYRPVARGDIVVFLHPQPSLLIKRVVGLPGDRLRVVQGRVWLNGAPLSEPYAVFDSAAASPVREIFPARLYADPEVDPAWWRQMNGLVEHGELTVPPGEFFVLGDNRNHSKDSRYWGFVPQSAIVARPLAIYFSVQPRQPGAFAADENASGASDRLGHKREAASRWIGFARWERIFRVVR